MNRLIASIIIFFNGFGVAFSQDHISVDDVVDQRDFMPYEIPFYVDSTNRLTFFDISRPSFSNRFKPHPDYVNNDFKPNASYWIRLPIRHNPTSQKMWLLEFYDQTIDHIEAFIPRDDGSFRNVEMGDGKKFSERILPHKNFEILIDMKSDTTLYYYFKVQSSDFADLRIALRSVNWFVHYALSEYFLFGIFYGMILIISLYNLLVFLAIREIKNIYYILYIISVATYAISLDGIGFQYLWPSHPEWNDYAVGLSLYSLILWSLVFTRRFLRTKAQVPSIDRLFIMMIALRSVWFVIALLFFPKLLSYRILDIIPLSLIFYAGIVVWRRGYRPARFFVLAYGILFSGFFLRTLVYFNVLRFTILSHYSLHISFVLEMLLLTFALGDRIRILKAMRDRAMKRIIHEHEINMKLKDKVNLELEEKVLERTTQLKEKNRELAEMNRKLEDQANQINQINSMLDLDNWKLKNSIKEVLNERLMEKTMDYKQFRTLYSDHLACYRSLENLKWEKGFKCRKCMNEKYFEGTQKFSRRCTKCGYNESITAFTIFHSIKFPIDRAFYIAYLVVAGKNDATLEELSSTLEVRLNTVWSFRHKVQERMDELEKRGRRPVVSRWEDVILILDSPPKAARKSKRIIARF